jgi:hypothetical protein
MDPTRFPRLRVLAGALLLVASCATAPRSSASPPRMKDSAPEKVAAQRTAAPHGLQLEQQDERWGFDAARERRREQDAARARKQPSLGDKAVDVTPPPAQ